MIFVSSLVIALALAYRFLGDYMYGVVSGTEHNAVERFVYKVIGVNPAAEQSWGIYTSSPPRWASQSRSRLCGASPARAPTTLAISGST